jgi:hypothetical protein
MGFPTRCDVPTVPSPALAGYPDRTHDQPADSATSRQIPKLSKTGTVQVSFRRIPKLIRLNPIRTGRIPDIWRSRQMSRRHPVQNRRIPECGWRIPQFSPYKPNWHMLLDMLIMERLRKTR